MKLINLFVIFFALFILACGGGSTAHDSGEGGGESGLGPLVDNGSVYSEGGGGPNCSDFGLYLPQELKLEVTGVVNAFGPSPNLNDVNDPSHPMQVYSGLAHDPTQYSPNGEDQTLLQLRLSMDNQNIKVVSAVTIAFYFLDDVVNYLDHRGDQPLEFASIDQYWGIQLTDGTFLPATFSDQIEGEFYSSYGFLDFTGMDSQNAWMDEQGLSRGIAARVCGLTIETSEGSVRSVSSNLIYFQFHHGFGP